MNIPVSEKHGVNPSVMLCFFCHEATGVALHGRLPYDEEAPRQMLDPDMIPCEACRARMAQGIQLVEANGPFTVRFKGTRPVRGGEMRSENGVSFEEVTYPRTTGHLWVITEDAARRMFQPQEFLDSVLGRRMAFIDPATARAIGLYDTDVTST